MPSRPQFGGGSQAPEDTCLTARVAVLAIFGNPLASLSVDPANDPRLDQGGEDFACRPIKSRNEQRTGCGGGRENKKVPARRPSIPSGGAVSSRRRSEPTAMRGRTRNSVSTIAKGLPYNFPAYCRKLRSRNFSSVAIACQRGAANRPATGEHFASGQETSADRRTAWWAREDSNLQPSVMSAVLSS